MGILISLALLGTTFPISDDGPLASVDIILNEFMAEPLASCSEELGEWIELFNRSGGWINLSGWSIENELGQVVTFPTYLIPPEGFFVLASCSDISMNGGVSPDFTYNFFRIQNTGRLILRNPSKGIVDELIYDGEWPVSTGSSCERINPGWVTSLSSTWARATDVYGDGDYGTPGQMNSVYENSFAQNSWAFIKAFVQ